MTKNEFDWSSAILCGRMVSLDRETRVAAAKDATVLLSGLPESLRNSKHCQGEIKALNALIARVLAEDESAHASQ